MKLILLLLSLFSIISFTYGAFCSSVDGGPPSYNGLPCATTTRYWDGQMGACGCGTGNTDPFSWQWTSHTAAASQINYDPSGGSWCGSGCGSCFELTPTGDCPYGGNCAVYNSPITIMVTNRCPYIGNEVWCPNPGETNQWGYGAHFDLMDYMMTGWVDALQWNDPVVTYRQVPCGNQGSPTCDQASQCQCPTPQCTGGSADSSSSDDTSDSSSSDTSTSTTTSGSTTSDPTFTNPPSSTGSGSSTSDDSSDSSSSDDTSSTSTGSGSSDSSDSTSSDDSSDSSSSDDSSDDSNSSSCSAKVSQTVGQTWIGGGLINIAITNTGTASITNLHINLNVGNSSQWNLNFVSDNLWTLPWYAFPILPNQKFSSAGYTYENTSPRISLSHVSC